MASFNISEFLAPLSNAANPTGILQNDSALQAAYCATPGLDCLGICPNTDMAGVGVRFAFYIQILFNTILIYLSPSDASAGSWASTILTGALVIPAIIQKSKEQLSLHHSVLVLNYATLATISSLAIAPKVHIWRGGEQKYRIGPLEDTPQERATEGRVILGTALILQVCLQWSFAVFMFVNARYSQEKCSATTIIVWPGGSQEAWWIDSHRYWGWALWMLSYLVVTAVYGWIMVWSCPSKAHNPPAADESLGFWRGLWATRPKLPGGGRRLEKARQLRQVSGSPGGGVREAMIPVSGDATIGNAVESTSGLQYMAGLEELEKDRWKIAIFQFIAVVISAGYITISELQIKRNIVLPGEEMIFGFSQVVALLLTTPPLWSLGKALIAWVVTTPRRSYSPEPSLPTSLPSPRPFGSSSGSPNYRSQSNPLPDSLHSPVPEINVEAPYDAVDIPLFPLSSHGGNPLPRRGHRYASSSGNLSDDVFGDSSRL